METKTPLKGLQLFEGIFSLLPEYPLISHYFPGFPVEKLVDNVENLCLPGRKICPLFLVYVNLCSILSFDAFFS